MTISWWWCLPLALGAALASAAPLAIRWLHAETAEVDTARRAVSIAASRTRGVWASPTGDPTDGEPVPPRPSDVNLDNR